CGPHVPGLGGDCLTIIGLWRLNLSRREVLVKVPARVYVFLRLSEQPPGLVGVAPGQHPEAVLLIEVLIQRDLRRARIELERVLALPLAPRVEAVERPLAG